MNKTVLAVYLPSLDMSSSKLCLLLVLLYQERSGFVASWPLLLCFPPSFHIVSVTECGELVTSVGVVYRSSQQW